MTHTPTLCRYETTYWFECSCGFIGDVRTSVFGASVRWKMHMGDVVNLQVREVVARADAMGS